MCPADSGPHTNRLIHETSPYLLQHAHNPVDWFPWGPEAFERASREDRPIFLSVGYSTCHWCHVMERESFEDPAIAERINEHFVPVKVDREERPDIDEIYMNATQLLTGRGGWPNSVWLTPDGRPWYAGTYFPPSDRGGMPGLPTVLEQLDGFWQDRRADVEKQADAVAQALRDLAGATAGEAEPATLSRLLVDRAVEQLRRAADERWGGFGSAPKFPPHSALALLQYVYETTAQADVLALITATLNGIARGGIRDHLGGGFHRYATDERWFLPHFEKMLYDQAQLIAACVEAHRATGDATYGDLAREACHWVLRDLMDEGGAFHSAYDADSEGVEGKFYLWTRDEIAAVLADDVTTGLFCLAYGVSEQGNYRPEHTGQATGESILYLPRPLPELAQAEGLKVPELLTRLDKARQTLLAARRERPWPERDDKVLTAWNGLMIAALARAGHVLHEPLFLGAAQRAADFILHTMRPAGQLLRTYRAGQASLNAYLDDHACLAQGLLELHAATGEDRWRREAGPIVESMIDRFYDAEGGGFFYTSDDHESLLVRQKSPFDSAVPSGNGVAVAVLLRMAALTGQARYADLAQQTLQAFVPQMHRAPRGTETLILAAAMFLDEAPTAAAVEVTHDQGQGRPDARAYIRPVSAEAFSSHLRVQPNQTFHVAIRLNIDRGWHVYGHGVTEQTPTQIEVLSGGRIAAQNIHWPPSRMATFGPGQPPVSVYEEHAWFVLPLTVADNAQTGRFDLTLRVTAQACDDRSCLRPEQYDLTMPITLDPDAPMEGPRHRPIFEMLDVTA